MRDDRDNVIPFPAAPSLDTIISDVMAKGDQFAAELKALLEKWQFAPSYIESVVPELMEAYLNDDETPIWETPGYRAAGTDVDG